MGANISLPPIPDTADAKMKEYLTALTKVLQQKQVDDYNTSETMKESISSSHFHKGIAHYINDNYFNPVAESPIEMFGIERFNNSSNIIKLSSTQILLKAGKTYRLTAVCRQYNGLYVHYYWKDLTTGTQMGTVALSLSPTYANPDSSQPTAECIACPQVDSVYTIIATNVGSGSSLYNGASYAIIEELEAYLPIVTKGYSEIDRVVSTATSKIQCEIGAGIIETGYNTNGRWIKFSDGTMIQWGYLSPSFVVTSAGDDIKGTFPTPFYDTSYTVYGSARPMASWSGVSTISIYYSGYAGMWAFHVSTSMDQYFADIVWNAIGRWKA